MECYSKDLEKSCVENHPEFNNLTTWTWNKCVSYDDYCTLHGYSGYQQIQNDTEVYGSINLPYLQMLRETNSQNLSSFRASTEESQEIIYQGGGVGEPPHVK